MSDHNKEEDPLDRWLQDSLESEIPEAVRQRFRQRQDAFYQQIRREPSLSILVRRIRFFRLPRLAWAGGTGLVMVLMLVLIGLGRNEPTWAQVSERFRSVSFFNATIYFRTNTKAPLRSVELWQDSSGRQRLLVDQGQVIFGQYGEVTKSFDLSTRKEAEPDPEILQYCMQKIKREEPFSIESILRLFPGQLNETTPQINDDADVARDLLVFDLQVKDSPGWMRIWTLRSSHLPVRLESWYPPSGERVDVQFAYSKPQADVFFNADAFSRELNNPSINPADLAYAFMKDPAGKPVTQRDIPKVQYEFRKAELEQIGMTKDGLVWLVQRYGTQPQAERKPASREIIYGVWVPSAADIDRGRGDSIIIYSGDQVNGRRLLIFAPLDYPFDARWPAQLTLSCRHMKTENDTDSSTLMETRTVSDFLKDAPWPQELMKDKAWNPTLAMGKGLQNFRWNDYARIERILAAIPGDPATNRDAFERDAIWVRLAINMKRHEPADLARARAVVKGYADRLRRGEKVRNTDMAYPIGILAAGGKLDEAHQAVREIIGAMKPENRDSSMDVLAALLLVKCKAGLTPEQVDTMMDQKMAGDKRFPNYQQVYKKAH